MNELELAQDLINFIEESPTAFHAVKSAAEILEAHSFVKLQEENQWYIKPGGKYYFTKNDSAILAFIAGMEKPEDCGLRIIGAHTDSPTFRIKPSPEMVSENNYIKLNTEVYGGPILNTWMDRPLSLAGRVVLKGDKALEPVIKFVNIKRPLMIIPNLAIHMNRNVNSGVELNRQKDMLPLLALINDNFEKDNCLLKLVAEELKAAEEDIADFDLFLYESEKGCTMGLNNEFISSSRLDDLSMVHAAVKALAESEPGDATYLVACFDNEEVGSATKQGADSPLLSYTIERILLALGKKREDLFRAIAKSFMISADLAHAVHPNSGEKYDPVNRPIINQGPVIKISARQSYTTDSVSSSMYEALCKNAGVPVQKFVNRSDELGGKTIGPVTSTQINLKSVDIGTPILAMHSVRELGGVLDHNYVLKSFLEFFKK